MPPDAGDILEGSDPPVIAMVADKAQGFTVRLSPDLLRQIDALILERKYTTRNDFVKQAVIWKLNQEEYKKTIREEILNIVRKEPEFREELVKSLLEASLEGLKK